MDQKVSGHREGAAPGGTSTITGVDDSLNGSLNDMLDLLWQQVERLKVSMEHYRLSEHPQKREAVRWHVQQIDERQTRMDEIKSLILQNEEVH